MNQNPVESNPENPEKLKQQEDKDCLEYFLSEVGIHPDMDRVHFEHLRTAVETAVWTQMETRKDARPERDIDNELKHALRKEGFGYFVPKTRAETQAVIRTPEKSLARAAKVRRTEPLQSAKTSFQLMKERKADARDELDLANGLMITPEDDDSRPDIAALRQDHEALMMLADHLSQHRFLANDRWPAKHTREYKNLARYNRGMMLAAANWAGDHVLADLFQTEYSNIRNRFRYWNRKVNSVARTTSGALVKHLLDSEHKVTEDVKTEYEKPPQPEVTKKIDIKSFNELIPATVEPALLQRAKEFEAKSHRIETLVRQGISRRAAEKSVLGSPGVYYNGQLVGAEPKDSPVSVEALVRAETRSRPNPARNPGVRRNSGYDKQDDPSNPRPI